MVDTVIDYKIVANFSINELETDVRALIAQGWQPFGGPSLCDRRNWGYASNTPPRAVMQMLVKYLAAADAPIVNPNMPVNEEEIVPPVVTPTMPTPTPSGTIPATPATPGKDKDKK